MNQIGFGQWLRNIRKNKYQESIREFSKRCGISHSCLRDIELGKVLQPTEITLNSIQKGLGIKLNEMDFDILDSAAEIGTKRYRYHTVLQTKEREVIRTLEEINKMKQSNIYQYDAIFLESVLSNIKQTIDEMLLNIDGSADIQEDKDITLELEDYYFKL